MRGRRQRRERGGLRPRRGGVARLHLVGQRRPGAALPEAHRRLRGRAPEHHDRGDVHRLPVLLGEAPDRGGRRRTARRVAVLRLLPARVRGARPPARPRHRRRVHRRRRVRRRAPRDGAARGRAVLAAHGLQRVGDVPERRARRAGGRRALRGRHELRRVHRVDGRGHGGHGRLGLRRHRPHPAHPELRERAARRGQEPLHRGGRARLHREGAARLLELRCRRARGRRRAAAAARGDLAQVGLRCEPHGERGELEQLPRRLPRRLGRRRT